MTLTESGMSERLDRRGLLAASHGPGCYALAVAVPDNASDVTLAFRQVSDADLPDSYAERLARADRVAYVGASRDVYERLCDHAAGEKRKATFLAAFSPQRVVDVWPHDSPFTREFKRARTLVRGDSNRAAWANGEVFD
jgi:hypothetical protein